MGQFSEHIVVVDDKFEQSEFPERFENQIYLSTLQGTIHHEYTSPFSIKFCKSGTEAYTVNGQYHLLEKDRALIVNESSLVASGHRDKPKSENLPNVGMSIFLSPAVVADVFSTLKSRDVLDQHIQTSGAPDFYDRLITPDHLLNRYLGSLMNGLLQEPNTPLDESIYYDISEHLLHFHSEFFKKVGLLNKTKYATKKEIYHRVSIAREILHSDDQPLFDLDRLARQCCMSKYFLLRSFRDCFGVTPKNYHAMIQAARAKVLLRRGLMVTDVALTLGFSDPFTFSRSFKRTTGLSPSEFRKNHF